jgi:hypothetical protein
MNGFNPLEGLKDWHVWLTLLLAVCGVIGLLLFTVTGVIWIVNHIQIV